MVKKLSKILLFVLSFTLYTSHLTAQNQDSTLSREIEVKIPADKAENLLKLYTSLSRLKIGGYGEAVYSRNFYSDNFNRYSQPEIYKNNGSHGRTDLPHVTLFLGYEFGKGWRMNTEIEFEHGGSEAAVELEAEESGEYESEIGRGGEVALEQFWIEKTFNSTFNLRMGHIIVPIGYTNGNHLPNQFFTVYRPEGENTILPCTWHETGISLWGFLSKKWKYEIQVVPGLDSEMFNRRNWIQGGSASPYEFKVANKLAGVVRLDNYSIKGLRLGLSGYCGQSFKNSMQPSQSSKFKDIKGTVYIGAFDFDYKGHNIISRGYFDYGHLMNSEVISTYNKSLSKYSPSARSNVASDALCAGFEIGYDFFSQIQKMHNEKQKCYVFGRYEYYDSMFKTAENIVSAGWTRRQKIVGGINYFPIKEIVVKAEYAAGLLKHPFNNENSFSIGIAYAGFFN